jgi:hypothetical protein
MSDTLNALTQQQGQSNLLNLLSSANVANPLGAIQAGQQAAGTYYDVKQKQANVAWGNALQQATDENGNVDLAKAQSIASKDPMAAAGMQTALANNATMRGQQIQQTGQLYNMLGEGAGSLLNDPSDQNIASIRARFQNLGMPAGALAELDRIQAIPDLNQRKTEAFNHLRTIMGAQYNLAVGGYPVPAQTQMPQGLVTTTTAPPSPYAPTSTTQVGGVPSTMSPSEAANLPTFQYTDASGKATVVPGADVLKLYGYGVLLPPGAQGHVDLPPGWKQVSGGGGAGSGGGGGVRNSDGTVASPAQPPRLLNVPGQSGGGGGGPTPAAPTSGPPAPPGGSSTGPYTGGGIGTVLNPGGAPAPAPAAPAPRSDLGGGVPVASTNALAPNVGPASPPSSAVPGDVNAILAGMNRTRGTPVTGPQTAAAYTFGPSAEEVQGYKTSAEKLSGDRLAAANFQSTQFPYVQALQNYGEGTKTGPTSDFWNQVAGTIRTPLAKIGINIGSLDDNTQRQDALGKWLANIQSGNPMSAKSDAELAQVLKGSASTHINETTGADMVKAGLALQRMNVAATREWDQMSPQQQAQYGTYLRFLGNYNSTVDPRAFSVDTLNPAQKQRLAAQIKSGSEADAQRFESSLALARRNGMVGGAGSAAMP